MTKGTRAPSTTFLPLDRKIESEINASTRTFLEGLARASEEAEDDDELEAPSLEISDLSSWLMQSCAPNNAIQTASAHYIRSLIAAKLVDLEQRCLEIDARITWLFAKNKYKVAAETILVNYPLIMEKLSASKPGRDEIAIVSIPGGAPEDEEDPDDDMPDIVFFVLLWEGHYLARPVKCNLKEAGVSLSKIQEAVKDVPRPTVEYQQGNFLH